MSEAELAAQLAQIREHCFSQKRKSVGEIRMGSKSPLKNSTILNQNQSLDVN
jgi:hypothetical protein